jgi:hypothetical protein
MARLLEVSTSGYYIWLERQPYAHARRDVDLLSHIRAIRITESPLLLVRAHYDDAASVRSLTVKSLWNQP